MNLFRGETVTRLTLDQIGRPRPSGGVARARICSPSGARSVQIHDLGPAERGVDQVRRVNGTAFAAPAAGQSRCNRGHSMSGRRLIYLLAVPIPSVLVGIFSFALIIAGYAADELGFYFALVFGTVGFSVGAFRLWCFSIAAPKTPPYRTALDTVHELPLERRADALRRMMLAVGVATILATAVATYPLVQLHYGWKTRVSGWGGIADLYNFLGFWPALLLIPGVGLAVIIEMGIRRRAVRKARGSTSPGSE